MVYFFIAILLSNYITYLRKVDVISLRFNCAPLNIIEYLVKENAIANA